MVDGKFFIKQQNLKGMLQGRRKDAARVEEFMPVTLGFLARLAAQHEMIMKVFWKNTCKNSGAREEHMK